MTESLTLYRTVHKIEVDRSGDTPRCVTCGGPTQGQAARQCRPCYLIDLRGPRFVLAKAQDRFWAQVDKSGECWLWTGRIQPTGYVQIMVHGKRVAAHRIAYEWLVGPIPDGLVIDHLCRVRNCVNPAHLEAVTGAENSRRTVPFRSHPTACPQGHPYDADNSYFPPNDLYGRRYCRTCHRASVARSSTRRKGRVA